MVLWYPDAEAECSPWQGVKRRRKKGPAPGLIEGLQRTLKTMDLEWSPEATATLGTLQHWPTLLQKTPVGTLLKAATPQEVALAVTLALRVEAVPTDMVDLLWAELGPVAAVLGLLEGLRWFVGTGQTPLPRGGTRTCYTLLLLEGYPLRQQLRRVDELLLLLRRQLLAENQEPLVEAFNPLRESLRLEQRIVLDYLFPTQVAWATADAEAALADLDVLQDGSALSLLATDLPQPLAETLWERSGTVDRWGFDAVRKLGDAAFPAIEKRYTELLANRADGDIRRIVKMLALFPAAGPWLVQQLDSLTLSTIAADFCRRHPEVGVRCLAPSMGRRDKLAFKQSELLVQLCLRNEAAVREVLPELEPRLAQRLQKLLVGGEEAEAEDLPALLVSPPWRGVRPDLPSLPSRPLDELAVAALCSRNRTDDQGSGDSFFRESAKTVVRRAGESSRLRSAPGWRRDRFRLVVDAALTAHEDRGPAIALLRQMLVEDPSLRALIPAAEEPVLQEVLASDPLLECPGKVSASFGFLDLESLPRLSTRSGKRLALPAVKAVVEMLSFSPKNPGYPGLVVVKEALEPASLESLAWAMTQSWVEGPASPATSWALLALLHLGSDGSIRKLPTLIRRLLREQQTRAAMNCLELLGAFAGKGSELALMYLAVFQRAREEEVQKRVAELLDVARGVLGIPAEELEERLIPDLDLSPSATTTLDYGPRQFEVRFDENLEAQLFQHGERLRGIPKAANTDDPEKAAAAADRWKGLKADSKTLLTQLRKRLETSMILRRSWRVQSFSGFMLQHPLIRLLARRLVWGLVDGGRCRPFRVAEDLSFADLEDTPMELPEQGMVVLPHPLDLEDRAPWLQILEDYGIIQPFPQMAREVFRPTVEEMNGPAVKELPGQEILWHPLRGSLESRGWELEYGAGFVRRIRGGKAILGVSSYRSEAVRLTGLVFDGRIRDVPAVLYSEVRRDLEVFRS